MKGEKARPSQVLFREGGKRDLEDAFKLMQLAMRPARERMGVEPLGGDPRERWQRARPLLECLAGQPEGAFWIAEQEGVMAGFARSVRLGGVDELSQLMVVPELHGQGVGRALLERCWPDGAKVPRTVVAAGGPPDLSLYVRHGVGPAAGHWQLRVPTVRYRELRSRDVDEADPGAHVLGRDHALVEWARLEPAAIGRARPELHDHFARQSTCLACMGSGEHADAVCWVRPGGEIGPAAAARPEDLVPVVLAALDRVARTQEPPELGLFAVASSRPLIRALARLDFRVVWPGWILTSEQPPAIERYLPTRPALVL